MKHYCLIDGNNIAFASQLAAMDKGSRARRLFAGDLETTAINGVLQGTRETQRRYPDAQILTLWDTGKAWRYGIYPDYKGNRKSNPTIIEAKTAIASQHEHFIPLGDMMGVPQVTAENYEADDLAAFLANMLAKAGHKVTLVTRDQDWLQMVRPNVSWYDRQDDKTITHVTFEAMTGYGSPEEFSEAKVLKGDSGDNVFGIKGVGDVAADNLIRIFGTVEKFLEGWEEWQVDHLVKGHPLRRQQKAINTFLEDPKAAAEKMALNRQLMDLRIMYGHAGIRAALRKTPGAINRDGLRTHLSQLAFLKIVTGLDEWLAPFVRA